VLNSSRRFLAWLSGALLASPVLASVHHVRRDAGAGGDGTSWATAFQQVQDALAIAQSGDQVWVAKGTYRPGTGASPRTVRFDVSSGIALYGGFAGDELTLDERDWVANETVLSGDLLLDDGPGFANRSDNCHRVVVVTGRSGSPVTIDGFTVRGGNANGIGPLGNEGRGGGVFSECNSTVSLRHLQVVDNEATGTSTEGQGGGVYSIAGGLIDLEQCTLRGNRAGAGGGAYFFAYARVVGCLFQGNVTTGSGDVAATLVIQDGNGQVANTAIVHNQGMGLAHCCAQNNLTLANSIVWGNSGIPLGPFTTFGGGGANVVEGGSAGGLDLDPLFVDPLGPDGVAGTGDEDYRLSCVSPLIDRGSNALALGATLDLAGHSRFVDDPAVPDQGAGTAPIVDIGPYEFVCGCDHAETYCTALPNTSGLPASIGWSGSTSLFANAFTLLVSQGPPLKNGLFYYGPLETSVPWGDGIRCVGGSLQRLAVIQLDANGLGSFQVDFTNAPAGSGPHQLFPGDTSNFQFYFRDPVGGPAGWNYSDALSVAFCP
jgi:hypothetical protein